MGALLSAFAAWLGRSSVLRFLAVKAVLYSLFVVILPVILWNVGVDWVSAILNWILSQLPQDSALYVMTGLAGYLGSVLNLPHVISILVSGYVTRLIIRVVVR